jgi:hypothetical protein
MDIRDAQRDVRTTFIGTFPGSLVTGTLWLVSAALATWSSTRNAIVFLVVAGAFIFPLTQLVLRLMGRRASLPAGHPMNALAMQVAFTLPLNLPLVGAATLHRLEWFYPSFMLVVGTHYLPFISLYGMWQFGVLATALIVGGLWLGLYGPPIFSLGGWITAGILFVWGFVARSVALRERATSSAAP